ncbi:MAG: glycosyltransferase family 4 protein [Chitinophagaceae bacterium]
MKKVLLITYPFPPLGVAGSLRPFRFAKYLIQYDWLPIVITIKEREDLYKDRSLLSELPSEVMIHRTSTFDPYLLYYSNRANINTNIHSEEVSINIKTIKYKYFRKHLSTIKNIILTILITPDHQVFWFPFAIKKAVSVIVKDKINIIITTSPPNSGHLIGLALKKIFRIPWIADFRDPWVDNFKIRKMSSTQKWIESKMEKWIMENADRVIANTDTSRQRLIERYNYIDSSRFETIYNGFEEMNLNITGKFNKFTIAHTGLLYPSINPYFFIEPMKTWLNTFGENAKEFVQVLFVGIDDDVTKKIITMNGLSEIVKFVDRVSHKEALEIATNSDVLLISLGFEESNKGWIPMKLYDYLSCKKPIIAFLPDGEAANIIRNTKSGFVITKEDLDMSVNVFKNLYENRNTKGWSENIIFSDNQIRQFEIKYLTAKLAKIMEDLISKNDNYAM